MCITLVDKPRELIMMCIIVNTCSDIMMIEDAGGKLC